MFARMPLLARNAKQISDGKCGKSDAKYTAIHFLFFVFCKHFMLLRDKCIASFTFRKFSNGSTSPRLTCGYTILWGIICSTTFT